MDLDKILRIAVRGGASDIILKPSSLPRFRYRGELVDLRDGVMISEPMMESWLEQLVPHHLKSEMKNPLVDLDFSYESDQGHRFRINFFRQRRLPGLVFRVINNHIKPLEELQLPKIISHFANEKRGLILVTGATGSGKTTTLASLIEKINQEKFSHIITIEDPIEYIFFEKKSTINQREIGTDTISFDVALRSALRQNPDVILVGELRDREATETALMAAETGHLVLSTLHTLDAPESITRLLSYFPPHQHESLRLMISQTLRAIVSQRLIQKADDTGMVAAMEIMIANELVREEIRCATSLEVLKDAIKSSKDTYGMQSFDQSLQKLYEQKIISKKTALSQASNKKDLQMLLSGIGG